MPHKRDLVISQFCLSHSEAFSVTAFYANTHHTMIGIFLPFTVSLYLLTLNIVSILILEYASRLFASSSRPTLEQAFDEAHSRYLLSSNIHNAVTKFFTTPSYNPQQFTEFVLENRL